MSSSTPQTKNSLVALLAAWLLVGIPLAYGISQTVIKAAKLFGG